MGGGGRGRGGQPNTERVARTMSLSPPPLPPSRHLAVVQQQRGERRVVVQGAGGSGGARRGGGVVDQEGDVGAGRARGAAAAAAARRPDHHPARLQLGQGFDPDPAPHKGGVPGRAGDARGADAGDGAGGGLEAAAAPRVGWTKMRSAHEPRPGAGDGGGARRKSVEAAGALEARAPPAALAAPSPPSSDAVGPQEPDWRRDESAAGSGVAGGSTDGGVAAHWRRGGPDLVDDAIAAAGVARTLRVRVVGVSAAVQAAGDGPAHHEPSGPRAGGAKSMWMEPGLGEAAASAVGGRRLSRGEVGAKAPTAAVDASPGADAAPLKRPFSGNSVVDRLVGAAGPKCLAGGRAGIVGGAPAPSPHAAAREANAAPPRKFALPSMPQSAPCTASAAGGVRTVANSGHGSRPPASPDAAATADAASSGAHAPQGR